MAVNSELSSWSVHLEGLSSGVLTGTLTTTSGAANTPPDLDLCVNGTVVCPVKLGTSNERHIPFSAAVPASVLSSGSIVLLICHRGSGLPLASMPIFVGQAPSDDVAADIEGIRAELIALKRAFLSDASIPKLRAIERDLIVAEAVDAARLQVPSRTFSD